MIHNIPQGRKKEQLSKEYQTSKEEDKKEEECREEEHKEIQEEIEENIKEEPLLEITHTLNDKNNSVEL